jgi:rare lipoprotein A
LPPERPFDLGTIPGAVTPVRVSSVSPNILQPRPVVAGLYYAANEKQQGGFQKSSGFAALDQSRFLTR